MEMYFYEQSIFFHVISVSVITSCTKKPFSIHAIPIC